ncbi:peptidylprolyl isomerase [Arenimonas composti]|uniref:Peptidyl-prolyl cis-trans isomerase n=1 Tax=Arenimonas composti TR7-09 = DSM 18010 TaxID=1121013 RepID=A0A091BW86_9GAMM|nr:peptidylprolyl isomerase [Arenimonas composti]KFN48610.1 hypothetical protein P873_14015 [Arenimonas composti TR7-09 = DSM 18010]
MLLRILTLLAGLFMLPAFATPTPVPAQVAAEDAVSTPAPPPRVMLVTNLGEIVVELDPVAAPKTVENFLAYARDGHYNGTIFHRVVPGLLVQAGGFTPDLQQKPTRAPVPSEADNGLGNRRGTLAAARERGAADSATAQFFINLADNPQFDRRAGDTPYTGGYAVFGRVVLGMDVIERIAAVPTAAKAPFTGWVPVTPVIIERVQVLPPPGSDDAARAPAAAGETVP